MEERRDGVTRTCEIAKLIYAAGAEIPKKYILA
jgi:hypothetical protein